MIVASRFDTSDVDEDADTVVVDAPIEPPPSWLHPRCRTCGWRQGGVDSWDLHGCRCGIYSPPVGPVPGAAYTARITDAATQLRRSS